MSLSIGRHVSAKLKQNEELTAIVGTRIFPVIMPQGTAFPFVEFETQTGNPEYTKDGVAGDYHTIVVNCVAKSYEQSLDMAEAVREALELEVDEYDTFKVTDCRFDGCEDDYIPELDAFCATLTFSAETADTNN